MSKSLHLSLSDENAMLAFGAAFAEVIEAIPLDAGAVIFLRGDLGAGKTTFTRGLLRTLGVTGAVKSPTYTLVESYVLGDFAAYHFDLYRLRDPEELEFMGARDYFRPGSLCIIEWPERGGEFLRKPDINLIIQTLGLGRAVQLGACTEMGELLLERLNAKNIRNISKL